MLLSSSCLYPTEQWCVCVPWQLASLTLRRTWRVDSGLASEALLGDTSSLSLAWENTDAEADAEADPEAEADAAADVADDGPEEPDEPAISPRPSSKA